MLSTKRTQIRTHIRKAEMQQQFAIRRRELVHGKQELARQLFQEVEQDIFQGTNMDLIGKLLAYHKQNPNDQNTYVIISNYLFNHDEDLAYFYPILVYQPRYLQHHMWCLAVISIILSQRAAKNDTQQSYLVRSQMGEVLQNANDIMRMLVGNLKSNYQKSQKDTQIWQYYMEIIKTVLYNHLFEEFPNTIVELFVEATAYSHAAQTNNQELIAVWKCLASLLGTFSYQLSSQLLAQLFARFLTISELVLKSECIELLQTLVVRHPTDFMSLLFGKVLIKQVLYLLQEVPSLKGIIANLLRLVITQCNLDQLRILFQLRGHIILAETMQWSMNAANNACLQDCLIALYNILSFLLTQSQAKLYLRIKMEIQSANFDQMIQGLSCNHQTDVIWRYVTLIIDDFYSLQEEC